MRTDDVDDGIYFGLLTDGLRYRLEKTNGEWYFSDGTGWKEKLEYPNERIVSVEPAGHLPTIQKDTVYENKYPLTDFFPRDSDLGGSMNIQLTPVSSSQIVAIGYHVPSRTLAVQFKNKGQPGPVYHYANVEPETFDKFQSAESKGAFFGEHIKPKKDKYPFVKVTPDAQA